MRSAGMRRLAAAAMLAGVAFVLSSFVYLPNMAPFQHFVNVLAAALVGPWYALAAALVTGLLRMALLGRTIQAVVGAVFGAVLAGLLYRATGRIWAAAVGEVIGTGLIAAVVSWPLMEWTAGWDLNSPFYFVPFYAPSSILGAVLGAILLGILKRSGTLGRMQQALGTGMREEGRGHGEH